jgi:hypothetical protein
LALLVLIGGAVAYRHWTNPERVRLAAQRYLARLVGAQVTVQSASFSLFDGIQLTRVSITEPLPAAGFSPRGATETAGDARIAADASPSVTDQASAGPIFACSNIRLRHRPLRALLGHLAVDQIVAVRPTLAIYRDERTRGYNVAELFRGGAVPSTNALTMLPTVRLRDARIRLGRRDGQACEIVEDLTLNVVARASDQPGVYDLEWEGGGQRWSCGKSRLDLNTKTITDIEGGLPWVSLEGASLAAEAEFEGLQRWCDLLGLTGQLQVRDFHVSVQAAPAVAGAARTTPQATIQLHDASLSIPLGEADKSAPVAERYLRLSKVNGQFDFGPAEARARLSGKLHGSDCTLSATLTYPPSGPASSGSQDASPQLAAVGFELELSAARYNLPRRDDPYAPAQARFVNRWRRMRHFYRDFDPHGVVNLQISAAKAVGDDAPVELRYALLEAVDCDASYRLFPYRLVGLSGSVEFRPEGIFFNNVTGEHEGGRVTVNGSLTNARWFAGADLAITGRNIPIDRPLHDALSPRYQRIWDRFDLSGAADIDVALHRQQGAHGVTHPWESTVDARFKNASAEFLGFPYPLEQVTGLVHIDSEALTVTDLRGSSGSGTVTFNGTAGFGGNSVDALDLDLAGADLAFDERLDRALSAEARRMVKRFDPAGTFDLTGKVALDPTAGGLVYDLQVALNRAKITFDRLSVPIDDVTGRIGLTPGRITIDGLTGRRGQARIVADGSVHTAAEQLRTDLTITCRDLDLDDELRDLLPVDLRRVWATLNVTGVVDSVSTLRRSISTEGPPSKLETTVTARGLNICYDRFPLPITDVHGNVTVVDGQVRFSDLSGRYGQAKISLSGEMARNADGLSGELGLSVTGMPFCEDLREALPWRWRRTWNNVRPQGTFDLHLSRLALRPADGGGAVRWNFAGELTLHDAGLDLGAARLRNVAGRLAGAGQVRDRGQLSISTTLDLDRVDVNDRRVTELTGRIDRDATSGVLPLSNLRGRVYGGTVEAAVQLDYSSQPAGYSCSAVITDMQLQELLNSNRAPDSPPVEVAGDADAHLYLSGQLGDPRSTRGGGRVHIEKARMFRLPLMLAILDVLGLAAPEDPPPQSASADFVIQGPAVELRDILVRDNTVAMIGSGRVNRGPVDLDLRLVAVSPHRWFKLGVLTEFLEGAARELVEINVRGPLSDPAITATPLRSVGGALDTLFGHHRPGKGGDAG